MPRLTAAAAVVLTALAMTATAPALPHLTAQAEAASRIVAVVDGTAITSGDMQHRINFLRLQRAKGNLSKLAKKQLIDEVLKREAVLETHTSVSTEEVDAAYARFAKNNHMSIAKLTGILNQAGVGPAHFKAFIAVSMSWPRAVRTKYGSSMGLTPGEIGSRIVASGSAPKVNEYVLEQVIFVVPAKRRGAILGKRRAEAQASRKKFPGCSQALEFAATMHDVSVRELGRFLEPQIPDKWRPLVKKASINGTTSPLVTEKGVEYLAICSKREVADDAAAAISFQKEDAAKDKGGEDPNAEKYLKELRAKANIIIK